MPWSVWNLKIFRFLIFRFFEFDGQPLAFITIYPCEPDNCAHGHTTTPPKHGCNSLWTEQTGLVVFFFQNKRWLKRPTRRSTKRKEKKLKWRKRKNLVNWRGWPCTKRSNECIIHQCVSQCTYPPDEETQTQHMRDVSVTVGCCSRGPFCFFLFPSYVYCFCSLKNINQRNSRSNQSWDKRLSFFFLKGEID